MMDHSQSKIIFHTLTGEKISCYLSAIKYENEDDLACYLIVITDYQCYQKIKDEALFNLYAHLMFMGEMNSDDFEEKEVEIKLSLKKTLVAELKKQSLTSEKLSNYLTGFGECNERLKFLLNTESWLLIEFKQIISLPPELEGTGELKMGYHTLWENPDKVQRQLMSNFKVPLQVIVVDYFQENNIEYEEIQETILKLRFQGKNGQWVCLVRVDEAQEQCLFYSVYPDLIPENLRQTFAVCISEINYDLLIGNLEIDLDDGELRYRTSIDVKGDRFSQALFEQLIANNVNTMDSLMPTFQELQELPSV